ADHIMVKSFFSCVRLIDKNRSRHQCDQSLSQLFDSQRVASLKYRDIISHPDLTAITEIRPFLDTELIKGRARKRFKIGDEIRILSEPHKLLAHDRHGPNLRGQLRIAQAGHEFCGRGIDKRKYIAGSGGKSRAIIISVLRFRNATYSII